MPLIYSFCSWFSVRTGSIIISITSLIQAGFLLFLSYVGLDQAEFISFRIELMLDEDDMLFTAPYFLYLQLYTKEVFTVLIIANFVYIGCCLLLIRGAIKLEIIEILPYVVFEFIRLVILTTLYTISMMLIKKNVLDFNVLIVCLISGGFLLILLYYFWLCPVSLIQCIIRKNKLKSEIKSPTYERFENKDQFSFHYNYLSDFKFRPVMPNRDYYQYQYGNLTKLHF